MVGGGQVRQVEGDHVVPENVGGAFRELVESLEGRGKAIAQVGHHFAGIGANRAERMNDSTLLADFEVQGQASGKQGGVLRLHGGLVVRVGALRLRFATPRANGFLWIILA